MNYESSLQRQRTMQTQDGIYDDGTAGRHQFTIRIFNQNFIMIKFLMHLWVPLKVHRSFGGRLICYQAQGA